MRTNARTKARKGTRNRGIVGAPRDQAPEAGLSAAELARVRPGGRTRQGCARGLERDLRGGGARAVKPLARSNLNDFYTMSVRHLWRHDRQRYHGGSSTDGSGSSLLAHIGSWWMGAVSSD